jgi:hypothetical protein
MRDAKRFRDLKKGNRLWIINGSEIEETKLLKSEMDWSMGFYIYIEADPNFPIPVDPDASVNNSKTVWLDSEKAKQHILEIIKRKWKQTVEQLNFLIDEEKRLNDLIQKYGG